MKRSPDGDSFIGDFRRLLRSFVGYGLFAPVFCAATLWRFEQWVKVHQPRLFFTELLKQIDLDFPEEQQAAQVGDTFALVSQAREQTRTELLRATARRMLAGLERVRDAACPPAALAGEALFGAADEAPEYWLDKAQRDAREAATALAAQRLLVWVQRVVADYPTQRTLEMLLTG